MLDNTRQRTCAKALGPHFIAAIALGFIACGTDSEGSSEDPVQSTTGPEASTTETGSAMPGNGTPVLTPMRPTTPTGPSAPPPIPTPPSTNTPPAATTGPQGLGGNGGSPEGQAGSDPVGGAGVNGLGGADFGGNGNLGGSGNNAGAGAAAGAGATGGVVGGGGAETAGAGGQSGTETGMSSGCGTEPGIPSNTYNNGEPISIMAADMQRRYILRVPDNYDNTKPYKLIIAWHQLDGNDVQMYANDYYHLLPLSGDNAIFVAPNGQKNGSPCTTTNNGDGGCGWPNSDGADVALGDAVVDEMKANFCIDTNRIFATGWSYGGSMSYKHACERGLGGTKDGVEGYIRGIAVYSGAQLSGQCSPSTPVAYYGSHGTNDGVLGYDGGVGLAENFAEANGCSWETPTRATGDHVCTEMTGCPTEYPTTFCSFNGDHTPDPRDGNQSSWQYQLVWDFFDQF